VTYQTTYDHLKPRLEAAANRLRELVGEGNVWENECCGYDAGFDLTIGEGDDPNGLDIRFCLNDADEFEGGGTDKLGNIECIGTWYGGEIFCQLAPYNYTPNVWCPLTPRGWPELERRLGMIESCLPDLAEDIKEQLAERRRLDPEVLCICGHKDNEHRDADLREGPNAWACTIKGCPCDCFESREDVEGTSE
jgi:hypothetical protein